MKKLTTLFSFIALIGLIFLGCQSTEDVTSPVDDLEKQPGTLSWGTPPTPIPGGPGTLQEIDIVAGQFYPVGKLKVSVVGTILTVEYVLNPNVELLETHLAVESDPNKFIVNKSFNPQIGQFEFSGKAKYDNISLIGRTTDGVTYIAAHAVVRICDEEGELESICPTDLPASNILRPYWMNFPAVVLPAGDCPTPNQSLNSDIGHMIYLDFDFGDFYGWCVDNQRQFVSRATPSVLNENCVYTPNPRTVEFWCTYDDITGLECIVELPDNLPIVNWLINNRLPAWDYKSVQSVIWKLLNPSGDASNPLIGVASVRAAIEAAITLAGDEATNFVPDCDNPKVLVLAYTKKADVCDFDYQVVGFEYTLKCNEGECHDETAWAFNVQFNETLGKYVPILSQSALFPGHQWFRYFGYQAL